MSNNVFANNREISCKESSGKTICAFPDVCMTPPQTPATPPGVPVPYSNTAMASDTTKGSKKVKIVNKPVGLKNKSYFKTSSGDEAGSAPLKGVVTHKNKGKVYFQAWSFDVKFEGKNVCRHLDITTNNHGSQPGDTPPMVFTARQTSPPSSKNWDIDCILEILCKKDKDVVKKAKKLNVSKVSPIIFDDPIFKNGKWTTEEFIAGGTASGKDIEMIEDMSCEEAATTIYHEVWHTDQKSGLSLADAEYDAYYNTEKWTIKRGLPSQGSGLRTTNAKGETVASLGGAKDFVHRHYPVTPPTSSGTPVPQVVGKSRDGTKVLLDNGTMRPVKEGDTFPADAPRNQPKKEKIPPDKFECP